jgi:Fe-S-cluster containining protein
VATEIEASEKVSSVLHIPPGINYECTSCGKCCGGWAVPLTPDDFDRMVEVDWAAHHGSFHAKTLFRDLNKHEQANTPYTHKIVSETGACPFLADNLCFMHSKFGADFKPSICQLFPYAFSITPSGVYATVSFVSMGSLYNSGRPLAEQRQVLERKYAEFKKLYTTYKPDWSKTELTKGQLLGWDEYLAIERRLFEILDDTSLPLEKRLLKMSSYLVSQVKTTGGSPAPDPPDLNADSIPLSKLDRHLLAYFHRMYYPIKALKRGQADFGISRLISQYYIGGDKLPLPGEKYRIAELKDYPWPDDDPEMDNLLYRYIYSFIFGKKFFGAGFGHVSVIAGFHHLLMLFCLIKLQTKATAKFRGAILPNMLDLALTVRQTERQVGETKLGAYGAAAFEMLLFSHGRARRFLANT